MTFNAEELLIHEKKKRAIEWVLSLIQSEMDAQDKKWGVQNNSDYKWSSILTEEIGEVAKECLEIDFQGKSKDDLLKELIQVAAVSVQWALQVHEQLENNGLDGD